MVQNNTKIKVYNRDRGVVVYEVPDLHVLRTYHPGETKTVSFEEIEKLSFMPGGRKVLQDSLLIENKEAYDAIFGENNVVPEYYYTREEIVRLLTLGSYEQLVDCLNFAPDSVIDLVKEEAVAIPLNDVAKRELILQKTGFNVNKAIEIKKEAAAEEPSKATTAARTATPVKTTAATPQRMATPIK